MRVLVTGGAGFIGSHVVDRLLLAGYEPCIFDLVGSRYHAANVEQLIGDVLDITAVGAAVRGCDAVVHLAAIADVNLVDADPLRASEVNAQGTAVVLEAIRQAGHKRVLFGSTIWVYGNGASAGPIDEEARLCFPNHPYTATKIAAEMFCNSYRELYGVDAISLRLGIPFGPRSREAAVVASFVNRARAGSALTVAGDGQQRRQFVYIEDLADGVVAALGAPAENAVYNLVGEESTSVLEVAQTVRELVANVPIVHTLERPADAQIGQVLASRANKDLGWQALTPFREGVRRYVDWLTEISGSPDPSAAPMIAGNAETVLRHEAGEL